MIEKSTNPWIVLIGLSLACFLGCIDFTIVNTALPDIQSNLHSSVTQLQWIITIFMLALASFMVINGRLADIYGRRKLLYIGMLIFAVSSLGAALAPTIHWLIAFRFIQGISVAILYTVPIALIPSIFPENLRGKATGIIIGVNGFGLAIGPVIGGFILSCLSWRWIFFVNLPLILLSFLLCVKNLKESKCEGGDTSIDWIGFILLLISLPLIVLVTVQASHWGWVSFKSIGLYSIAVIALIIFYFVEIKSKSPIIEFKLFINRTFIAGLVANFALAFFYSVSFFLLPLYLHNVLGFKPEAIGLTLLPATAMVAILSPFVGHYVDKHGPKTVLLSGFMLFAVSALMQVFFTANTSIGYIISSLILFGIGWAFILSPSIVASLSSIPESSSGVGMGMLGTLHNFGGAIGLAIGTVIYQLKAKSGLLQQLPLTDRNHSSWLNQVVANPEQATSLLVKHLKISLSHAQHIFHQYFTQSFSYTMWLLVAVSLIAFFIVAIGLRKRQVSHQNVILTK